MESEVHQGSSLENSTLKYNPSKKAIKSLFLYILYLISRIAVVKNGQLQLFSKFHGIFDLDKKWDHPLRISTLSYGARKL